MVQNRAIPGTYNGRPILTHLHFIACDLLNDIYPSLSTIRPIW